MTPEQRRRQIQLLQMQERARIQEVEAPGFTDYAAQAGAGSQQGIAQMLGLPVDAVAGGLSGIGQLTGLWGPIENPVGGSASISSILEPFREGIPDPSTTGERFARRIGEEVGAGAVGAPLSLAAAPGRAGAVLATEAASSLGSGSGAALANEIAPGSAAAEIIGALAGGIPAGMAASRLTGLGPTDSVVRGGIEDQRARASDAYDMVRADQYRLPVADTEDLGLRIMDDMSAERMSRELTPGSSAVAKVLRRDLVPPTSFIGPRQGLRIEDVEDLRRLTREAMPVTASPRDQRLATRMRDEITDYLSGLQDPVADALREGRDAHRRASAAQSVADASTKAARRAASTGSGGNEINAMRQNLRSILDNPRRAQSFTAAERELMGQVVEGTAGQNALRSASRFAPTSGGLSAMLGIGGAMANPAVALPIMAATEGAKFMGERSTRRVIDELMQSIAPDRILSVGDPGLDPVVRALLGARVVSGD